jgi:hypothetical protein
MAADRREDVADTLVGGLLALAVEQEMGEDDRGLFGCLILLWSFTAAFVFKKYNSAAAARPPPAAARRGTGTPVGVRREVAGYVRFDCPFGTSCYMRNKGGEGYAKASIKAHIDKCILKQT